MEREFTKFEKDFFARMAVHMKEGQTFEQAAKTVVDRDKKLVKMFQTNRNFREHVTQEVGKVVYNRAREG